MNYQLRPFYVSHEAKEYRVGSAPNDAARIFTIETQSSKPQLIMAHRPPGYQQPPYQQRQSGFSSFFSSSSSTRGDDPVVASANFHSLSSKIDITLRNSGQPMIMKKTNPLSSSRTFYNPSLGELRWKMEDGGLFSSSRNLIDQQGNVIARFEKGKRTSLLGKREDNTISVLNDQRFLDSFLEVVVITCIAAVEYDRQSSEAVGKAGGEAGAAVAGE